MHDRGKLRHADIVEKNILPKPQGDFFVIKLKTYELKNGMYCWKKASLILLVFNKLQHSDDGEIIIIVFFLFPEKSYLRYIKCRWDFCANIFYLYNFYRNFRCVSR